jgi:hypothetical protein
MDFYKEILDEVSVSHLGYICISDLYYLRQRSQTGLRGRESNNKPTKLQEKEYTANTMYKN